VKEKKKTIGGGEWKPPFQKILAVVKAANKDNQNLRTFLGGEIRVGGKPAGKQVGKSKTQKNPLHCQIKKKAPSAKKGT